MNTSQIIDHQSVSRDNVLNSEIVPIFQRQYKYSDNRGRIIGILVLLEQSSHIYF